MKTSSLEDVFLLGDHKYVVREATSMNLCDVDEVQMWLANGLRLLPKVEQEFLAGLVMLRHQSKVCLLPQYALQNYSDHIRKAM